MLADANTSTSSGGAWADPQLLLCLSEHAIPKSHSVRVPLHRFVWAHELVILIGMVLAALMGEVLLCDAPLCMQLCAEPAQRQLSVIRSLLRIWSAHRSHNSRFSLNLVCSASQLYSTTLLWTALLTVQSVLSILGGNSFLCAPPLASFLCSRSTAS